MPERTSELWNCSGVMPLTRLAIEAVNSAVVSLVTPIQRAAREPLAFTILDDAERLTASRAAIGCFAWTSFLFGF